MKFVRLLALLIPGILPAQSPVPHDFENKVPVSLTSSGGEVSISTDHFKSGAHSLKWTWQRSEPLTFRDPASFAKLGPKAGFALWVYNAEPTPTRMVVDLMQQDKVVASGWFWMDYRGWRILGAGFSQLRLPAGQAIDSIRFHAPEGKSQGELFLDDLNPNFEFSATQSPEVPWAGNSDGLEHPESVILSAEDPSRNRPWLPKRSQPTDIEKTDIAKLSQVFLQARSAPGKGVNPDQLKVLRETIASYRIERVGQSIIGRPIDSGTALKPQGFIPYGDYLKTCLAVRNAYYQAKDGPEADELRGMFLDLTAHLLDQGWAQGIRLGAWDNYPIAATNCFYSMRRELVDAGLARGVAQALIDNYGSHSSGDFAEQHPSSSMDGLGFWHRELIACALMFPTGEEQVQHLRIAQRFLNLAIVEPNTIAPDGCAYHHGGFHYAYASYNLPRLVQVLRETAKTTFKADARAHERLRTYVRALAHTFSAGQQAYNLGMRAGTPMGSGGVATVARELALMGTPDGKNAPDKDMASIALWLMSDEKGNQPHPDFAKEPFKTWLASGIKPATPVGFVALNGAPLAVHRREGWTASIAGMSPFWRGLEIYGWTQQNNYGRYARHGSLVITSNGNPPNLKDSGWEYEGWNWCHFPGTTSLKFEASREIFDGYAMYGNGSPLAGGTPLGQDGLWGMQFQGSGTHFQKTYFCFENRITSVTTGIVAEKKDQKATVVTTLYQNSISPDTGFLTLDGEKIEGYPIERSLTFEKAHWLIDNKGTGYLIPAGSDTLRLSNKPQEWLYLIDKYLADPKQNPISPPVTYQNIRGQIKDLTTIEKFYKPTRGDFALGWFDHGPQPKSASCTYTAVIQTTPEQMRKLAAKPTQQLLRSDEKVHVIHDLPSDTFGYAIYQPDEKLPAGSPLRSTSEPCFVIIRHVGNQLHGSLAYTKLKNADPYPEVRISLVLDGNWKATPGSPVTATVKNKSTTIVVSPKDNTPMQWILSPP